MFWNLLTLLAAEAPAAATAESDPAAGWWTDIGGLVLIAFLLVVALIVLFKLMKGVDSIQGQAAEAESRFAAELAKLASKGELPQNKDGLPPETPTATPPTPSQPPSSPGVKETPVALKSGVMARQKVASLEELSQNLTVLRVITDFEGRVSLPMPPEGQIYRLRKGGACVLLPRLESGELMDYFCKRFEVVFAIQASGEVLVLERMQARVGDLAERSSSTIIPKL